MDGREFDDLVADITANGLRDPIWLCEILNWRNRWRACEAAGVALASWQMHPYIGDDALGLVLSLNLHRRHLDESQRAMVAAKIVTLQLAGDSASSEKGVA
jgi:hypothetical protein